MSREVAVLARITAKHLFTATGRAISLPVLFKNEQAQAARLPA